MIKLYQLQLFYMLLLLRLKQYGRVLNQGRFVGWTQRHVSCRMTLTSLVILNAYNLSVCTSWSLTDFETALFTTFHDTRTTIVSFAVRRIYYSCTCNIWFPIWRTNPWFWTWKHRKMCYCSLKKKSILDSNNLLMTSK